MKITTMEIKNLKQLTAYSVMVGMGAAMLCASSEKAMATPSTLGFHPSTDIYGKGIKHLDVDSYGKGLNADASVTTGLT